MNKMLKLAAVFLKTGFRSVKLTKGRFANYLIFALIMVSFMPLVYQYSDFIRKSYTVLSVIGQQGILIGLAVAVNCLVIFFFGIFMAFSTFYLSKDIESLLPMPIMPYQIIGAKFITTVVYEYMIELLIFLPIVINYGIADKAGVGFYIVSAIVFTVLPVIPLVLSSVIAVVIMSFSNLAKNKDRYIYAASIIAIIAALGMNVLLRKSAGESFDPVRLRELLLSSENSLMGITSGIFPGSGFASDAIIRSGQLSALGGLAVFLAISAAAVAVFLLAAQKLYFRSVVNISDAEAKGKVLSSDDMTRMSKKRSVMMSYASVEIKLLLRTPVFFINCVITNFIPIIIIFVVFLGEKSSLLKSLDDLKGFIEDEKGRVMFQNILAGLCILISGMNGIASTSISREGRGFFFKKYVPIPYFIQIKSKLLASFVFSFSGMAVFLIAGQVLIRPDPVTILLCIPVAAAGIPLVSMTGIIIDLNNPKLNWDSEQAAVKQNMNLVMNMMVSAVIAAAVVFSSKVVYGLFINPVVVTALLIITDIILYNYIKNRSDRLFTEISA